MTRVLPSKATDVLAGRHEAAKIAETLTVAYWLHGRDDNTARYLLAQVHEDFAALAAALGYTIAPIAAETEAAA